MRRIALSIMFTLVLLNSLSISATPQESEVIVWEGKEYYLLSIPLAADSTLDAAFDAKYHPQMFSTDNYRGYVGYWSIKDGALYLDSVVYNDGDCRCERVLIPSQSEVFAPYKTPSGVMASWVTGELRLASGRRIYYVHSGWGGSFEHEDFLTIKNGMLVKAEHAEQCCVAGNDEEQTAELANKFFERVSEANPQVQGRYFVAVRYTNYTADGVPTDAEVKTFRNYTTGLLDEEKLLDEVRQFVLTNPVIPIYYIRNEYTKEPWTIPIRFNETKKQPVDRP